MKSFCYWITQCLTLTLPRSQGRGAGYQREGSGAQQQATAPAARTEQQEPRPTGPTQISREATKGETEQHCPGAVSR